MSSVDQTGPADAAGANGTPGSPDSTAAGAAEPETAAAWVASGIELEGRDKREAALAAYRNAIRLNPDFGPGYLRLGLLLNACGRPDEATDVLRQAIAIEPGAPENHVGLANALRRTGAFDEAAECFATAIALEPDHGLAVMDLANVRFEQGKASEAISGYRRAIELRPDFALAHSNLSNALRTQGDMRGAIAAARRALVLEPELAEAHYNLSLALLSAAQYGEGWQQYAWRWRGGAKELTPRGFKWPRWRGQDLNGGRLLLHAEQGLGDTLQFARFVPILARRQPVLFAVQPPLVNLMRLADWPGVTVSDGAGLTGVAAELPLMSVPWVLGLEEATIPAEVPYLATAPERVAAWRRRLPPRAYRVGIAWRGRPHVPADRGRSFALRCLHPLASIPGVRLVSLQTGHGVEEIAALPPAMAVEMLGPDFDAAPGAFLDAAAVMMNLDLVVAPDTSLAHLAGALGRPVWIALQRVPDWRWGLDRADSPWYPTARLFRQRVAGDWDELFCRMATELARDAVRMGLEQRPT